MLSHAALNASLNAAAAVFLVAGFAMIRTRRIQAHRACMGTAFALSTAFLVSYVIYHLQVGSVSFAEIGRAHV